MALLKQDQSIDDVKSLMLRDVEDYIDYYSNPEFVDKELGVLEIVGIVLLVLVIVAIVLTVTIEVLVKKGKLPKIAARRAKKKAKRLAKKQARKDKKLGVASAAEDTDGILLADEGTGDITVSIEEDQGDGEQ